MDNAQKMVNVKSNVTRRYSSIVLIFLMSPFLLLLKTTCLAYLDSGCLISFIDKRLFQT